MRLAKERWGAIRTAISLIYTDAFNQAEASQMHTEFVNDIGDENFQTVEAPILAQIGGMREWIGDRQIKNLSEKTLTIIEKAFEETFGIKVRDLETGVWKQRSSIIAALAKGGIQLWDTLFIEAICNPGKWSGDGANFYATDRRYGTNGGLINNTTSSALSMTTFGAAYTAMQLYTGDNGKSLKVLPTHIIVGPANEDVAKQIMESEKIRDADNVEVNNPHRGKVKIVKSLDLVGAYANYWFLAAAGGAIKPVAMQKSKKAELVILDGPNDEMVFSSGQALFGTSAYGNAAAALPHLLYRGGQLVS